MPVIEQLITSGDFFDWVLAGIAFEGALLTGWLMYGAKSKQPFTLLPNLLAGASLMLAVKMVVTDAPWQWLAAALTAALLAHIVDLISRLREQL